MDTEKHESSPDSWQSESSRSRSSSVELFPSYDAEPILRPQILEEPAAEVVIGEIPQDPEEYLSELMATAAREFDQKYQPKKVEKIVEEYPPKMEQIEKPENNLLGEQVMIQRLAEGIKVYQDPIYGERKCLFDPKKPAPQKVKRVPKSYQLFLGSHKVNRLPNCLRSAAWRKEQEMGKKKEWEDRCNELKIEQKFQLQLGVIFL